MHGNHSLSFFSLAMDPSGPSYRISLSKLFPAADVFHFIFFTYLRWRYFIAALSFMGISLGSDMVHTAYMYLGIHFFILSGMAWAIITGREKLLSFFKNGSKSFHSHRLKLIGIAFGLFFILAPYIYIQLFCLKNLAFDNEHNRLNQMWSISHYFHGLAMNVAAYQELFWFRRMLDFTLPQGMSFFLGYMFFFLGVVGLTMSRDSRKWIFFSTILLLWMVNCPTNFISISLLGHWINVLTNPLKTMVPVLSHGHSFDPAVPFYAIDPDGNGSHQGDVFL